MKAGYRLFQFIEREARDKKVFIDFEEITGNVLVIRLSGKWKNTSVIEAFIQNKAFFKLSYKEVRIIHYNEPEMQRWGRWMLFTTSPVWDSVLRFIYRAFMPFLISFFIAMILTFVYMGTVS